MSCMAAGLFIGSPWSRCCSGPFRPSDRAAHRGGRPTSRPRTSSGVRRLRSRPLFGSMPPGTSCACGTRLGNPERVVPAGAGSAAGWPGTSPRPPPYASVAGSGAGPRRAPRGGRSGGAFGCGSARTVAPRRRTVFRTVHCWWPRPVRRPAGWPCRRSAGAARGTGRQFRSGRRRGRQRAPALGWPPLPVRSAGVGRGGVAGRGRLVEVGPGEVAVASSPCDRNQTASISRKIGASAGKSGRVLTGAAGTEGAAGGATAPGPATGPTGTAVGADARPRSPRRPRWSHAEAAGRRSGRPLSGCPARRPRRCCRPAGPAGAGRRVPGGGGGGGIGPSAGRCSHPPVRPGWCPASPAATATGRVPAGWSATGRATSPRSWRHRRTARRGRPG